MAKWFEEVRLSSRPIEEIGAAFYIREMLGNSCELNAYDLKEVFGDGYKAILENLRRSGALRVETIGARLKLTIVAPGDGKRSRCRHIVRTNRALKKFENNVIKRI